MTTAGRRLITAWVLLALSVLPFAYLVVLLEIGFFNQWIFWILGLVSFAACAFAAYFFKSDDRMTARAGLTFACLFLIFLLVEFGSDLVHLFATGRHS